jgi:hypothetical protein
MTLPEPTVMTFFFQTVLYLTYAIAHFHGILPVLYLTTLPEPIVMTFFFQTVLYLTYPIPHNVTTFFLKELHT